MPLTLEIPNLICHCFLQALWNTNKPLLGISEFLRIRHDVWCNPIFTLKCACSDVKGEEGLKNGISMEQKTGIRSYYCG